MRSTSRFTALVALLALVACSDSTGPTPPPPPPSDEVFGSRITFDNAEGPSGNLVSFDVTEIAGDVTPGDVISIDVLVEDSTESGWVPAEAGRTVDLVVDDDTENRFFICTATTNSSGHALRQWAVPSRTSVAAGDHIITASLTVPATGVNLTPDSILFTVAAPVVTYVVENALSVASDSTVGDNVYFGTESAGSDAAGLQFDIVRYEDGVATSTKFSSNWTSLTWELDSESPCAQFTEGGFLAGFQCPTGTTSVTVNVTGGMWYEYGNLNEQATPDPAPTFTATVTLTES